MDKPNQRQRLLEGRITRVENQMSDLAMRVSHLTDRIDMMTHHMQAVRNEAGPVVVRRPA